MAIECSQNGKSSDLENFLTEMPTCEKLTWFKIYLLDFLLFLEGYILPLYQNSNNNPDTFDGISPLYTPGMVNTMITNSC